RGTCGTGNGEVPPVPLRDRLYVRLSAQLRIVLYRGCPDHPAPPPSPLLGSPLSSTPIGRTGQRGFVQSGFNDVPHCAVPADCPRDLVEPSCIPTMSPADSEMMSPGDAK